uniref:WRKY domain-containing protein n=1 Tax=Oryza sativa subsp. japonica TaxID=39947 RepID=Q6YTM1_ORYSJ|nr:hypothetical protein [Oryza sativa Japonica Group]
MWGDGGALDTRNADECTTKYSIYAKTETKKMDRSDPAAVAVNARIQRWRPYTHGSGGRPPSPRTGYSSPPVLFLSSLDPAEGRGVGGCAAGGECGSDGESMTSIFVAIKPRNRHKIPCGLSRPMYSGQAWEGGALKPPPSLATLQSRRAAASVTSVAVRRRRRVRTVEEYLGCPFAVVASHWNAAAVVKPSRAAVGPRRRSPYVVVRRSFLHRCPRIAQPSSLSPVVAWSRAMPGDDVIDDVINHFY